MTPRPGRIRDTIHIDLPRPRGLDVREHPGFIEVLHRVNHLFQDMGVIRA